MLKWELQTGEKKTSRIFFPQVKEKKKIFRMFRIFSTRNPQSEKKKALRWACVTWYIFMRSALNKYFIFASNKQYILIKTFKCLSTAFHVILLKMEVIFACAWNFRDDGKCRNNKKVICKHTNAFRSYFDSQTFQLRNYHNENICRRILVPRDGKASSEERHKFLCVQEL